MGDRLAPAAIGAIIAATVSGIIQIAGLFINHRNSVTLDRTRRSEKIIDYVIAIQSEVEANVDRFNTVDLASNGEDVITRIGYAISTVSITWPRTQSNRFGRPGQCRSVFRADHHLGTPASSNTIYTLIG